MLDINTKVMIRGESTKAQAFHGQIGTITKCYGGYYTQTVFEVTLNKEYLGEKTVHINEKDLVKVNDFGMPIKPVHPDLFKKWVSDTKAKYGV